MKHLSAKIIIVGLLELLCAIAVLGFLFIQTDTPKILALALLSFVFIILHDYLFLQKRRQERAEQPKENTFTINRLPNLRVQLLFNLLVYLVFFVMDIQPISEMLVYLIPWSIVKYLSKVIQLTRNNAYFLLLKTDGVVKFTEDEGNYAFSGIKNIRLKNESILIKSQLISLPVYLSIDSVEKKRMISFFEENGKEIDAKF